MKFRSFPIAALALLLIAPLAGCAAQPVSGVYAAQPMAATACAPCGTAAAAYGAPAPGPLMVAAGAPQLGVQYEIGPAEQAKSVVMIPPNVAICLVNGVKCALDALFPQPAPAAHYVAVQPVQAMPAAAAPCAPAWQAAPPPPPLPKAKTPCPEPVSCVGPDCGIPVARK